MSEVPLYQQGPQFKLRTTAPQKCAAVPRQAYLRRTDFMYHSTSDWRVIQKKKTAQTSLHSHCEDRVETVPPRVIPYVIFRGPKLIRNSPPPRATIGP